MPIRDPDDFLPLPASAMQILVALAEGERHGYGIMRDVTDLSDGHVHLRSATLYGSLKRMVEQGLIEETERRPDPMLDDERRRYYRITALGRRVGAAEEQRLTRLLEAARLRRLGVVRS